MPLYSYSSVLATIPNGTQRTRVLGGNSRRVTLAVQGSSAGVFIANYSGNSPGGAFAAYSFVSMNILPFRDWGPAIQGEIWISHSAGGSLDFIVTEVFLQSECG